ncbi:general substrate transporter [Gongronella butleri]|nr:general substrate transporter [Gongronella butleri]
MGKATLYLASLLAGLCQVYIGYDSNTFSSVLVVDNWLEFMGHPNEVQIGSLNTCYTVPTIILAIFVAPYLQDRFGRRLSMSFGSAIIVIAALVMALTPNATGFWAGRVVLGVGQAFVYAAPTYMAEIATAEIRGRIVGIWQITWAFGALISTCVAIGATANASLGSWQWRLIEITQVVIPTIVAVGIWFVPESPRWLVEHDRIEDARTALQRLRGETDDVESELTDIVEAVKWSKENATTLSFREIFVDKSLLHRLLITCFLNLFNQVCGNNAMNVFGSQVYTSAFASSSIALIMQAVQDVVQMLGAMIAILWIDRIGRRRCLIVGACIMAVMLIIAASIPVGIGFDNISSNRVAAGFMVLCICLFYLAFGPSWGASAWIVTVEVFPMNVRAQLVGISAQFQNIGSLALGQAFPVMFANLKFYSLYIFAGFNVFMAIVVYFYLQETKGVSLEEMDELFGGVNRVQAQKEKDGIIDYSSEKKAANIA